MESGDAAQNPSSVWPLRGVLWLWLFAVLPVPIYLAVVGFVPVGRLALLTGLVVGSILAEGGGQISQLFLLVTGIQLVGYSLALLGVAVGLAAGLRRWMPRHALVVAWVAALVSILAAGVAPIYETPFHPERLHSTLVDVYRFASPAAAPAAGVSDFASIAPGTSTADGPPRDREPCADRNPLRDPYFGDTHVHTALSFDAMGQGTRNRPRDAYRYAKGGSVGVQPYDSEGRPTRTLALRRPLDFAMVSDHAELLGETHICMNPGESGYDSYVCWLVRAFPRLGYLIVNGDLFSNEPPVRYDFCGEGGRNCIEASRAPWIEVQLAAEADYDRTSACEFTTFVGYEWSGMPGGDNAHRNIVFRNEVVPELPVNYLDTPTEEGLWEALERDCIQRGNGCDALAIPHNSNVSNGQIFRVETSEGDPIGREDARRRSEIEVLVEITQHKGDSECRRPGAPTADELCGYETPIGSTMREMLAPILSREPAPLSFVREVLAEGVAQHATIGANPFKLGIIGSTDTHLGTPGMVDEDQFVGHAAGPVSSRVEVPAIPDALVTNPGGLAVVWAEENSRDALFDAMRRRETYGTSGPRMILRLFGGWDFPDEMCDGADFVERGYATGVPMGADLPARPHANDPAPRFAVWGLKDAGVGAFSGNDLQRIQIVKAWEEGGAPRERVYEVAGTPDNGADVELSTCAPRGPGFDQLCGLWTDPDFDPSAHAVYYARLVENPSCRWNQWECNRHGVDCSDSATHPGELATCCDPEIPRTIQERAWSSPIWYTPDEG